MQIGEQHLAAPQSLALDGQRLLHLHDHLALEDLLGAVDDARAGGGVLVVAQPRTHAGAALDQDLVAVMHQLGDRRGHQPDAVFVILDFLGNANAHFSAQSI